MPKKNNATKRATPPRNQAAGARPANVSAANPSPRDSTRRRPSSKRSARKPAPHNTAPPSAKHSTLKRKRRRTRIAVDEALRCEGMGEREYAASLGRFVTKVEGNDKNLKLMLDGIKEWGRHFQGKQSSESSSTPDAPVIVQLVHDVPRPARTPAAPVAASPPPSS